MANTIVKIGKMASTNVDAYLKPAQYTAALENGAHVVLGAMLTGDLNTYLASTPSSVTTQEVVLVEEPVLIEVEGMRIDLQDPRKFTNPANRPFRTRKLVVGDSITVSVDGFSGTPTVGQYAVPANGATKLAPAADLSGNTLLAYKVDLLTNISVGLERVAAYKLTVVRAL